MLRLKLSGHKPVTSKQGAPGLNPTACIWRVLCSLKKTLPHYISALSKIIEYRHTAYSRRVWYSGLIWCPYKGAIDSRPFDTCTIGLMFIWIQPDGLNRSGLLFYAYLAYMNSCEICEFVIIRSFSFTPYHTL